MKKSALILLWSALAQSADMSTCLNIAQSCRALFGDTPICESQYVTCARQVIFEGNLPEKVSNRATYPEVPVRAVSAGGTLNSLTTNPGTTTTTVAARTSNDEWRAFVNQSLLEANVPSALQPRSDFIAMPVPTNPGALPSYVVFAQCYNDKCKYAIDSACVKCQDDYSAALKDTSPASQICKVPLLQWNSCWNRCQSGDPYSAANQACGTNCRAGFDQCVDANGLRGNAVASFDPIR